MSDRAAEQVLSVIARYTEVPPDQFSLDTSFEELGIDSLDGLSLVTDLEEAFNVTISDDDALGIGTVRQAVDLLQAHLAKRAARDGNEDVA